MNMQTATTKQLLTIALHENCDNQYKYAACRELQLRKWRKEYDDQLVYLWGKGLTYFDIAAEIGVEYYQVANRLTKLKLWGKRVVR